MKKIVMDPNHIDYALVKEAADIILNGGVVAVPTETVYGLAVSAQRKDAVERLYKLKNRPQDKPFTAVVKNVDEAKNRYFATLPPFGYRLIEKFWPGPLTIIFYSLENNPIGIRVPDNGIVQEIISAAGVAVYLSSANISGEKEISSASEVERIFNGRVDLIVDGGKCLYSRSSTVIDLTYHPFKILREGVISDREIIETFMKKRLTFVCAGNTCRSPMAQFLLKKTIDENMPYFNNRYEIISRGISAVDGERVSSHVKTILNRKDDIDVENFVSKRIDRETILSSDLIFTMEDVQRKYILDLEPTAEGRVFNLGKFLTGEQTRDIVDPAGKDLKAYENTYELIEESIEELRDWL